MPSREWRFRIEDMLEAIDRVSRYTEGWSKEQFEADEKTVDAVIRNLIVVGEAARHVDDEVWLRFPDIPWKKLRALRNVVVHEYFGVDPEILWETLQQDLPPLVPLLRRMVQPPE